MSKENEKTLKVYDEYGFDYVKTTFVHEKKNPEKAAKKQAKTEAFLKESFSALAARDKILEIGSGGGENAEYLAKLEYRVTASDVSEQFQEVLREKGLKCRKLNILTDEIDELFDGALAWRVFVHFTPEDLEVAAKKIFKALRPGGRFVCNIINRAAHDVDCEWQDFDNDYHLGVDRFFQYYSFDQAEKILTGAGFDIAKFFYDGENDKWMIFVLEKPTGVRKEVEDYIKNVVLPEYEKLPGHTITHINQVISHSFMIAESMPELNRDMIYVIAAYHDLGRLVNDDNHHIESGKMLRRDEELGKLFSEEEIEVMAEAVEDHRASLKGDPRSVYGKIVSSADRDMDINDMLERSYDYTAHLHPEMSEEEVIEEARIHLREKFTPDGYGAKKVYFPTPDEIECFKTIGEITRDPLAYSKIMKDFNKKRWQ